MKQKITDSIKYLGIPLVTMVSNNNGNLPVYIRKYNAAEATHTEVKPRLNTTGKVQRLTEQLLEEIYMEYTQQTKGYLLAIKANLLKLLVTVGRCFEDEVENSENGIIFERHRDGIVRGIEYIDTHYMNDISIEDVVKAAMLSRSYFCYLFKIITNKTFVEYLNELRINYASLKLKDTQELIMNICFDSGFNNISHFNRVFKKIMGVSPRQYRDINKGKDVL